MTKKINETVVECFAEAFMEANDTLPNEAAYELAEEYCGVADEDSEEIL